MVIFVAAYFKQAVESMIKMKSGLIKLFRPIIILSIIFFSCGGEDSCLAEDWEGVFVISSSNIDMECAEMLFEELEFSMISEGMIGLQGFELAINDIDCSVSWVENDFGFLVTLIGSDRVIMRFTEQALSCEVMYDRK